MKRDWLSIAIVIALVLVAWEAVMRLGPWWHNAVPAPTAILVDYWTSGDVYLRHAAATIRTAAIGFAFGNMVAITAAVIFCRFPAVEQVLRGVNLTLFVIPMLVVGPLLVLVFRGDEPQIILAAVAVYFPTMAATLLGLRDIDPRLVDVVQIYGGNEQTVMRFIRLRAALPSILAGFRVASAGAVLGAILGEFGSGVRWGLGTFLLGSLPEGIPARLWGIGFAATSISMAGYLAFSFIGRRVAGSTVSATIANRLPDQIGGPDAKRTTRRGVILAISIVMPIAVWWLLVRGTGLSPIIAPGPVETLQYVFFGPGADKAQAMLLSALGDTLPAAALGLLFGLAAAFVLASLSVLRPQVVRAVLPPALMLQSTPLVALAPIMLLIFGRDLTASVVTAVIVVFFGAFVVLTQGFDLVPRPARELVQVYGGSRRKELTLVCIPFAIKYLFTAAKLVAPRALLGVMVAEWLFTGTGLGHLVDVSRGLLEFEMAWAGAMLSILVAIAAYQGVTLIERFVR